MSKKIKDTDYLYVTAFIWGHEPKLLSRDKVDRMLEARSFDDVAKVLEECGYGDMSDLSPSTLEEKLSERRAEVMDDMFSAAPDSDIVNVFRIKYDYHNAKVLIKAQASGSAPSALMSRAGRIKPEALTEAFHRADYNHIPSVLSAAMTDAKETLARTGDPQLADFILDKAYYREFNELAEESGSEFLDGYAKLSVDSANLRTAVRAMRMDKDAQFLAEVLAPGGNIGVSRISDAVTTRSSLADLYTGSPLHAAAAEGAQVVSGGRLTLFEKLCDNALSSYVSAARISNISERVLVGYIAAVEAEISAVRIIMTGVFSGMSADNIKERLRDPYV